MSHDTVAEMVASARVLLQDQIPPYRYTDQELVDNINMGMLEARRVRPDLFLTNANNMPHYHDVDSTSIALDPQYHTTLLYFVVGHAQLRDDEDTQDARSELLLRKFTSHLLTVAS